MYSIGAVIILVGVVAKFNEWPSQDILLLIGLTSEAMVFLLSSVNVKKQEKQYDWEKVFPQLSVSSEALVNITEQQGSVNDGIERIKKVQDQFFDDVESSLSQLKNYNHAFTKDLNRHLDLVSNLNTITEAFSNNLDFLNRKVLEKTSAHDTNFSELNEVNNSFGLLKERVHLLANKLDVSTESISETSVAINDFNKLLSRINTIKDTLFRND
jgi:hypothetical protein